MSIHWPKPGMNSVSEYQASGYILPLTGSSNIRYLKYVASSITFMADTTFSVYDNSHDDGEGLINVKAGTRVKGKFLTYKCGNHHIVEMTNIPSASYVMPNLSTMVTDSNG